jgi:tripartite ATP-independent transporter DctM subunit
MSALTCGYIGVILMLVLLFLGMPLAYTFALSGVVGIMLILGFQNGMNYMMSIPFSAAASYSFIVMPLFMLMGDVAYNGGLTADAYGAARKWFGHLPGGLAITTTVASALFGALCGSGSTTAMVMTQVAWPEMKKSNYDPGLGLGSIVGAGPLAILIPPSVPLIMYGLLSGASIGRLFMAGWLPGILLTVMLSICTVIQVKINPSLAPRMEKAPLKERLKSLKNVWAFLVLIIVVMGGIWGGFCTVYEASGIGVIGAMIIIALMRRMNLKQFAQTIKQTCASGCAMFFMFVGIQIFNTFMSLSGIPKALATAVRELPLPPAAIIWVIVLLYLILGCFLDSPPVMMLTVGLLAPVVSQLGYDLVWFGIIVAFTVAVGALTPPVGINLFVVSSRAPEVPIAKIIKGMVPYLITIIITLVIIFYVPQISLLLPNLMFGS